MIRERNAIRHALLAVGLLALSGSFGGEAHAGMTYDAVNDFSLASNPNGPWSYGTLSALTGGTFTPDTSTLVNQFYTGEQDWFNGQGEPNSSVVERNDSGSTQSFLTIVSPTNLLRLDCQDTITDVRFTAQGTGLYNISGLFQRIDTGGTPVSVQVEVNGSPMFSVDNFSTFGAQEAFNLGNLSLTTGTVVDFVLAAPQFNNDSTGFDATITYTPSSVPEPASIGLVLVGLAGTLAVRRRLRRAA